MKLVNFFRFVVVSLCLIEVAYAENDWGAWQQVLLQGSVQKESPWILHIEEQLRVAANANSMNVALFRAGFGRKFEGGWSVLGGVGYIPAFRPKLYEGRIWQQIGKKFIFEDASILSFRLRTEQRRLHGFGRWGNRIRFMGRFEKSFAESSIKAVIWDEVLMNVNDVGARGTPSGFGQNRAFIGPGFALTPNAFLEIGYLNVFTHRKIENLHQSLIWTAMTWNL